MAAGHFSDHERYRPGDSADKGREKPRNAGPAVDGDGPAQRRLAAKRFQAVLSGPSYPTPCSRFLGGDRRQCWRIQALEGIAPGIDFF